VTQHDAGRRHLDCLFDEAGAEALLWADADLAHGLVMVFALPAHLAALRVCLDRIAPPRKDRPVLFELPPVSSAADVV
jgi:hypothetical protein